MLANTLFHTAPRDGTEFGTFNRTVPLDPLLDNPQARFDARQFTWLGSTSNEINTCVAWHCPAKTIEELRQHELMVAGTGPTPTLSSIQAAQHDRGTKFKIILRLQGLGRLFARHGERRNTGLLRLGNG